jgi:hypothetical protein
MMTFLPYSDFEKSAQVLDYKRLGKQRVETYQIIETIKNQTGWKDHPAVKMWIGYTEMLKLYFNVMVNEWVKRGYTNNYELFEIDESKLVIPWWMNNEDFHRAMRSRLIEKLPEFYESKFPEDKGFNGGKYFWPEMETKTFRTI